MSLFVSSDGTLTALAISRFYSRLSTQAIYHSIFNMAEVEVKAPVAQTEEKQPLERVNSGQEDGVDIPRHTSFVNVMVWNSASSGK